MSESFLDRMFYLLTLKCYVKTQCCVISRRISNVIVIGSVRKNMLINGLT